MSKRAEERGLEAVPPRWRKTKDGKGKVDSALPVRKFYIRAYEQAEKDLGWISVRERMPEPGVTVWTCVDFHGTPASLEARFYIDGKWYGRDASTAHVDYWMPVQPLPKEDEK